MSHIGGDENGGPRAYMNGGLVSERLLPFTRHNEDDLLHARMVVAIMAFPRCEGHDAEAEALSPRNLRCAHELERTPIEDQRLHIIGVHNPTYTYCSHVAAPFMPSLYAFSDRPSGQTCIALG